MKPGELQPGSGQPIEMGRIDFAAEGAEIRIAEVVRDDDQEIGATFHDHRFRTGARATAAFALSHSIAIAFYARQSLVGADAG